MNVKTIALKLAGGLLAAAFVVTALAGNSNPAAADGFVCPGTCTVDTRPDLVAANVDVTVPFERPWKLKVVITIQNAGRYNSGPFKYKLLLNGIKVVDAEGALAAGGATTVTYEFWRNCALFDAYTVELVVDYDNKVNESNEGNNKAQKTHVCY